jgi:hypothetical protein
LPEGKGVRKKWGRTRGHWGGNVNIRLKEQRGWSQEEDQRHRPWNRTADIHGGPGQQQKGPVTPDLQNLSIATLNIGKFVFGFYTTTEFFYFFGVLGNSGPISWTTPPALFCILFFQIGSCKLFAWAGLKRDPPDLCLLSS